MKTVVSTPPSTRSEIDRIFTLQQKHQRTQATSTIRERKVKLRRLLEVVLKYRNAFKQAMHKDFQKPAAEVDLTEIYYVVKEIKYALRNLRRWQRGQRVPTPLALIGTRSRIHHEPKGVVLIMSPWNFPINLTLGPLVGAIAAGNSVIIKPSEYTPNTTAVLKKLIKEVFKEHEVTVVEGGVEVGQELLQVPFNHIFFTGSPRVGQIVMKAAADHHASVTLELGGKSPTIVDETANLEEAVTKITWAKFLNSGQICIAPDYVYVHESKKDEFVELMREQLSVFYGEDEPSRLKSPDYTRIVNRKEFDRLVAWAKEAHARGANFAIGGMHDEADNYIAPTVLTDLPNDIALVEKEIFGPILPVFTFKRLEEVINVINDKEKPLTLYIYSKNRQNIKQVIAKTSSGSVCVNDSLLHYFNPHLPFGGVNYSGIGKSHGYYSFEAFSNAKPVLKQYTRYSAIKMMMPPYNDFKLKLINWTIRWF